METPLESETRAVVADPVGVGNLINTVTLLVNWDVARTAEDDQVFVLVIAVVADGTLGVFLNG